MAKYEIRTALLPFIFIFNNGLLMIDLQGPMDFMMVIVTSSLAMIAFVGATQNWVLVRNRWYETVALLLVCFALFRPGFLLDMVSEPYVNEPASDLNRIVEEMPKGEPLRLRVKTVNLDGDEIDKVVRLDLADGNTAADRLQTAGLSVSSLGDSVSVGAVRLGSQSAKLRLQPGDEIEAIMVPAERPSRHWFALPAFLLFALIFWQQRRRRAVEMHPAERGARSFA